MSGAHLQWEPPSTPSLECSTICSSTSSYCSCSTSPWCPVPHNSYSERDLLTATAPPIPLLCHWQKKERKSMKPRINRTPPLPSPSAPFFKGWCKVQLWNSCSLTLILPTNCWNALWAHLHQKWSKTKSINTCCCLEVYLSDPIIYSTMILGLLKLNLLLTCSTKGDTWAPWHFVQVASNSVIRDHNAETICGSVGRSTSSERTHCFKNHTLQNTQ